MREFLAVFLLISAAAAAEESVPVDAGAAPHIPAEAPVPDAGVTLDNAVHPAAAEPAPPPKPVRRRPALVAGNALRDELQHVVAAVQAEKDSVEKERALLKEERAQAQALAAQVKESQAAVAKQVAELQARVQAAEQKPCACGPSAGGAQAANQQAPFTNTATRGADPASRYAGAEKMARTLKTMRPKQAAALVERLDRDVAVVVMGQMPSRDAAAVLSAMSPSKAAELTTELSLQSNRKAANP